MKLAWYFDFISPFAYIQFTQFNRLPSNVEIEYKPILLAGLLNYWQNVGPAEVAPKRTFTYKYCHWLARKYQIPFTMPPAHPFNSLPVLRLALSMQCQPAVIQTLFEIIWQHGLAIDSPKAINILKTELAITDMMSLIDDNSIKQLLRSNTEEAAAESIFGVPTFKPQDGSTEQFWGLDAFDMLLEYIEQPENFDCADYLQLEHVPTGSQRKR